MENNLFLKSHPIDIYLSLDTLFAGDDWLSWEPETIVLSIKDDVPDNALDKVLAVQAVAANTSMVLTDANAFEKVVQAFCNNPCVMDVQQPPCVEEIVYAVKQIRKIAEQVHGDKAKDMVFHDAVPPYVAAVAKMQGWIALPKIIEWAEPTLNRLTGLDENSDLRKEHEKVVDTVDELYHSLDEKSADNLIKSDEVSLLQQDDGNSVILKKIIGALLYDPTILYK